MLVSTILGLVLARLALASSAQPVECPIVESCSSEASPANLDPCCVPKPGGLFVFRQRLQLDEADDLGNWGIDGIDVLGCDTLKPITTSWSSPRYSHEEISSLCLKSPLFGGESGYTKAEKEWAITETGEGVEELWARAWSSSGRHISTLSPMCTEDDGASGVPAFFDVLHQLKARFPVSKLLADADITPSSDTTYSLSEIEAALSAVNQTVIVTCIDGAISLAAWPFTVKGKFQSGDIIPFSELPAGMTGSNCPKEGIKYPSSVHAPPPKPSAKWDPIFRPQPRAIRKSHDESKLYHPPSSDEDGSSGSRDPLKLGFFKGKDQTREEQEDRYGRQFSRDEL